MTSLKYLTSWKDMQVRILHLSNDDPWVSREILEEVFGVDNPAVHVVERLEAGNVASVIMGAGWIVEKLVEHKSGLSVLFIKNEIENE